MNTNALRDIVLFVLANGAGFSGAALAYHAAVVTGLFVPGETGAHRVLMHQFYQGTMMTWMICALFSLCFFFIRGNARFFFLLASALLPFSYGMAILVTASP